MSDTVTIQWISVIYIDHVVQRDDKQYIAKIRSGIVAYTVTVHSLENIRAIVAQLSVSELVHVFNFRDRVKSCYDYHSFCRWLFLVLVLLISMKNIE